MFDLLVFLFLVSPGDWTSTSHRAGQSFCYGNPVLCLCQSFDISLSIPLAKQPSWSSCSFNLECKAYWLGKRYFNHIFGFRNEFFFYIMENSNHFLHRFIFSNRWNVPEIVSTVGYYLLGWIEFVILFICFLRQEYFVTQAILEVYLWENGPELLILMPLPPT